VRLVAGIVVALGDSSEGVKTWWMRGSLTLGHIR